MEGKLVIEVYEYSEASERMPVFEYIPCELAQCLRGKNSATLKEIIEQGFDSLPRRAQDSDKRQEILSKVEEADIACVELTNVVPVTFTYADVRMARKNRDDIILKGKYRLSAGNEFTTLKDAQRLTLIYSSAAKNDEAEETDEEAEEKEICLNITYLQE